MRYSGSSPRLPSRLPSDILLPASTGIKLLLDELVDMQEEREGLKTGKEVFDLASKGATSARHCLDTGSVISTMA